MKNTVNFRKDEVSVERPSGYDDYNVGLNTVEKVEYAPMLYTFVAARDEDHATKIALDLFRIYKSEETAWKTLTPLWRISTT